MRGDYQFQVQSGNWKTLMLFMTLQTQWVWAIGMDGGHRIGLNYSAITPLVLRSEGISLREWPEIFEGLRVMEMAVLEEEAGKHGKK